MKAADVVSRRELTPYARRVSYALTGYIPKPSILRQSKHSAYCRAEYRGLQVLHAAESSVRIRGIGSANDGADIS